MLRVFIQTNNKQLLGARLARYSIERSASKPDDFRVELMNVDETEAFRRFAGTEYLRYGRLTRYEADDLQSFTLSRFMPPELCGFHGRALVIDPDIFAVGDLSPLQDWDLRGCALACCRKKDAWDTSVMLLDCERLPHWKIGSILDRLERKELDYAEVMSLRTEGSIAELPRSWNSLDQIQPDTRLLHTTERLTQPWKTGLPIDFKRNRMAPILGFIPREWVHKALGRYPSRYQPHPDKRIERFFLSLLKEALRDSAVDREFLQDEVRRRHVREDIFEALDGVSESSLEDRVAEANDRRDDPATGCRR